MTEKPYQGRAIVVDTFQGLEITIPTKKNVLLILFLSFWLCGWLMGETFAIGAVGGLWRSLNFAGLFILIWLCGWTIGGFFAIRTLIWNVIGKEILHFEQGQLTVQKQGAIFFKPSTYDLSEAKNFRVQEDKYGYGGARRTGLAPLYDGGTIRFNYGLKTLKIAGGVDEAEAEFILTKLKSKKILTDKNF